jgi:hypothetical protein
MSCDGLCSQGRVGESRVVHNTHLFLLQIHVSSFGASQQGEMMPLFSVPHLHREAFHRLGVQDVTEFDSDLCSVFCLLREKNEKRNGCVLNVMVVIILARSNQYYPSVASMSQSGLWNHST